ncbi:mannosyltransferase complex subunit Alg1 [Gracilaria domingensis]|nr:mannosyltransferase complex subunit Alg1 [Gracilaria domingensis]
MDAPLSGGMLLLILSTLAALCAVLLLLTLLALLFIRHYHQHRLKANPLPPAILLVSQSPANHSPRVIAHLKACLHFAEQDAVIFLAEPPNTITDERLTFHSLPQYPPLARRNVFILLKKAISLLFAQASCLSTVACLPFGIHHIILATPPALPLLPLLIILRPFYFPTSQIIVDVHNLAYTLSAQQNTNRYFLTLARLLELQSLRFVHHTWTVSSALAQFLRTVGIKACVLRDLPSDVFTKLRKEPLSDEERNSLMNRVQNHATCFGPPSTGAKLPLIVSSTSWTPDEDLSMLCESLVQLDRSEENLRVVITGKGPLRAAFEKQLQLLRLQHVQVWLAWLPFHDYAALLSTAALGVSLHASSSALDLPMKAVDMLGTGLPVLALRYPCIHELVKDGRNGLLFGDSTRLTGCIQQVIRDEQFLSKLRNGAADSFQEEWLPQWGTVAMPSLSPVA